jgi:hypothetical protein
MSDIPTDQILPTTDAGRHWLGERVVVRTRYLIGQWATGYDFHPLDELLRLLETTST